MKQTESGHAVNAGNFATMVALCEGLGNRYNPSHPSMLLANIKARNTVVQDAMRDFGAIKEKNTQDIAKRRVEFDKKDTLSTMWHQALQGARVSQTVLDRAASIIGKIKGQRLTDEPDNEVTTEGEEGTGEDNTISTSQQGFNNVVANILSYTQLLDETTDYNPNEEEVKKTAITAYYNLLHTLNNQAIVSTQQKVSGRSLRDKVLYTDEDSVFNLAKSIKKYIRSCTAITPEEKQQIISLNFRAMPKKRKKKK